MRTVVARENVRGVWNRSNGAKQIPSSRRPPVIRPGATERGVALVVTLIMLSLITFLTVAFLALTRRERAAVTVTVEQTDARLALDAALARAQSDIITRLVEGNSFLSYDLLMSTNLDNRAGLAPGAASINNVSYFRQPGTPDIGNLVPPGDLVQVISNLLIDPRPPVFVQTNDNPAFPLDFRFYLDLNRNLTNDPTDLISGQPGDPHWIGLLEYPDLPHSRTNRFIGRYAFIALPESKSLDLNFVHNYVNPALPATMTLADGFARNQGFGNWELNLAGFLAELNPQYWQYANYNPMNFFGPGGNGSGLPVDAFLSAKELLAYRYASNINSLLSFDLTGFPNRSVYPGFGPLFEVDGIDGYANGPLMFGLGSVLSGDLTVPPINDNAGAPWPGSPNTNRYFSIEELVDRAHQARYPNFFLNLSNAMNARLAGNGPEDLNTFYRMIAQMGTDSAVPRVQRVPANAVTNNGGRVSVALPNHGLHTNDWVRIRGTDNDGTFRVIFVTPTHFDYEPTFYYTNNIPPNFYDFTTPQPTVTVERNPQIHLNFDNFRYAENQFVPWSNKVFFMATADRMLRTYTNFGPGLCVTNIEIFPTNQFNARVFQLLKQAANIADWRDNRFTALVGTNRATGQPDFPSIYWPRYSAVGTNRLYISDFNLVNILVPTNNRPVFDPRNATATNFNVAVNNFYATGLGVPWIVGAEKGYPNLNETILRVAGVLSRKLGFFKQQRTDVTPRETNQMFHLQLDPQFTVELWNSYPVPVPRNYRVTVEGELITLVSNAAGVVVWPPGPTVSSQPYRVNLSIAGANWPGAPSPLSFVVPGFTNLRSLPLAKYLHQTPSNQVFAPLPPRPPPFFDLYERNTPFYLPDWTLVLTNRLRFFLEDLGTTPPQLVDAVNVIIESRVDILELLQGFENPNAAGLSPNRYWNPQRVGGGTNAPYRGILEQIATSTNAASPDWDGYFSFATFQPGINGKDQAATNFLDFLTSTNTGKLSMQAPFNPFAPFVVEVAAGINDPLVHYLGTDYQEHRETNWIRAGSWAETLLELTNHTGRPSQFSGKLNRSYRPWGGNRDVFSVDDDAQPADYDVTRQDPLIRWSSEWDFPTNTVSTNFFGTIGWLGRVHRATPWQTIYFKGAVHPTNRWAAWAGDAGTHPTNDWVLADLFTVAVDPNARRGLLSINQTNRAAWAAALSGVSVLTNNQPYNSDLPLPPPVLASDFIAPNSPAFDRLWTGIETLRRTQPAGVFSNLAALFAAGDLTYGTNLAGNVVSSPFIVPLAPVRRVGAGNPNSYVDIAGLDDAAYERIPQQVLSLLKVEDQPRFAVYLWGQSLKPADRSILLNNALAPNSFGLCTNYQITGEVAAKAILRVDRRADPGVPGGQTYQTVIESYQLLPNP
jgi:hypothetical protein